MPEYKQHSDTESKFDSRITVPVNAAMLSGSGLVIVVVEQRRRDDVRKLAGYLELPYINVSLSMAARILDVPARRRQLLAPKVLREVLSIASGSIVAGRLGLLHHPTLQLNVVKALEQQARNRVVIVEWIGAGGEGVLTYAVPGHVEYRVWDQVAHPIIRL